MPATNALSSVVIKKATASESLMPISLFFLASTRGRTRLTFSKVALEQNALPPSREKPPIARRFEETFGLSVMLFEAILRRLGGLAIYRSPICHTSQYLPHFPCFFGHSPPFCDR